MKESGVYRPLRKWRSLGRLGTKYFGLVVRLKKTELGQKTISVKECFLALEAALAIFDKQSFPPVL